MSRTMPSGLPVLPTIIVLIAVGVMVRLGFWQLDRLHQKESMIARYSAAMALSDPVPYPHASAREGAYYRRSSLDCDSTSRPSAISGRNAKGAAGWAHLIECDRKDGVGVIVVLGWSNDPSPRNWGGGHVTGTIAPWRKGAARLVADPPLARLDANAAPNPHDLPNNHFSYAVQWFLFAATALVIYALAVVKRRKDAASIPQ